MKNLLTCFLSKGLDPFIYKAGFHWRRSRSRNQKRRAYDLVKTAFGFRLGFVPLMIRSAYGLVKTRLSESEAEADERDESQSV